MTNKFEKMFIIEGYTIALLRCAKMIAIEVFNSNPENHENCVLLTKSEFKHCVAYADNFPHSYSEICEDVVTIQESESSFMIIKEESAIITPQSLWETMKPIIPAILYLTFSENIATYQILDLFILSNIMSEMELFNSCWNDCQVRDRNICCPFLEQFGYFVGGQDREIDAIELNRFTNENRLLAQSIIKLMYLKRKF